MESIMNASKSKLSRTRTLTRALVVTALLGMAFAAMANNCQFAYRFCMPIYNACLQSGGSQQECHALLDQCILNNGCGTLP
jgi:hypothetical protein